MVIKTIEDIRKLRDEIREEIKSIDTKEYKDQTFGSENEYEYKSLIGGIEALLTDISALLKSQTRFIKISTYSERTLFISYLQNIKTYIDSPGNLYAQVDALKILLRNYNIRFFEDRFIEFEKEIDETRRIKINLQEDKLATKKLIDGIETSELEIAESFKNSKAQLVEFEKEILEIENRKISLLSEVELLEEKNEKIEELMDSSLVYNETIKKSVNEASTNEKLIKNFATNIQKSEEKITTLDSKVELHEAQLLVYKKERDGLINESKEMIDSARQALNYSTAQGISEAFDNQYKLASSRWLTLSWLVAGAVFMIAILSIGIWIVKDHNLEINILIGRALLIPILVIGLYFCLNQYSKQKDIIEDYAYKKVISQAIVGFSEQLKKNQSENSDEYVTYMKTALGEIHKDPLRKRDTKEITIKNNEVVESNQIFDMFEKFVNLYKNTTK